MIEVINNKAFIDGKPLKIGKFISKDEFRAFLVKEVKANRKYTCTETHCPLAEATGYAVDGTDYGILAVEGDLLGPRKSLPAWAASFVDKFDHSDDYPGLPNQKNAKRALFVLDNNDSIDKYWDDQAFFGGR